MKRTREISKRLYIEELERPVPALANQVTTLALGEESSKAGDPGQVITLAKGEEALKG